MRECTLPELRQFFADQLVERAWSNTAFADALLADPRATLAAAGYSFAAEIELAVLAETSATAYVILPADDAPVAADWRGTAEADVAALAAADPDFRAELLRRPRASLERAFGVLLPSGLDVIVLEEQANRRYLVLPVDPNAPPEPYELDDDALLEVVGGGRTYRPSYPNMCSTRNCGYCCSTDPTPSRCCLARRTTSIAGSESTIYPSVAVRQQLRGSTCC
jgi:hypothetical protein